jgi:type I restriction-modification system DNA methylase subunit
MDNLSQFETDLWSADDNLRANSKLTSSDYFMPVLGIIFLRHAANRFDAATRQIAEDQAPGKIPKRKVLPVDYVLANPPFNDSDWFRKDDDVRWQFGVPPKGNANFAWVQHFIHHLAPQGMAGFVLANGSMSSNQSGEGDIRRCQDTFR